MKSRMHVALLVLVVAIVAGGASAALRRAPVTNISLPQGVLFYSGVLTDGSGVPVPDGSYDVSIDVFDAAIGGNALCGTVGPMEVAFTTGRFRVQLSSECAGAIASTTAFVQVGVMGGVQAIIPPPGQPRPQIGAVPFALAAPASGVVGTDPTTSSPADMQTSIDHVAALGVPTGTILAFARQPSAAIPAGWALCDGSALDRTANAALFAVIGTQHGAGDGIMTFNVPDLRGQFLRGTDHARGADPDAASRQPPIANASATGDAVGSIEADDFVSHQHTGTTGPENLPGGALGMWYDNPNQDRFTNSGNTGAAQNLRHTHSFTTDASGGNETRPKNVGVDYIIKL